jgi:hypothetical protein
VNSPVKLPLILTASIMILCAACASPAPVEARLDVAPVQTVAIQVVLRGLSASSSGLLRIDFTPTQAWGDPSHSANSGGYGVQTRSDTPIEVSPGIYSVAVSLGGVRLAKTKELRLVPGCEPCLLIACDGIDWATLAKAVTVTERSSSMAQEIIRRGIKEQRSVTQELLSLSRSTEEEIRVLQEEFDKSPPARLEMRRRVDDF